MNNTIDALRISPTYTSRDWSKLNNEDPGDWKTATEIVRDRLEARILRFADACLSNSYSGFVVLAIDCLMLETLQQFRMDVVDGHGKSKRLFTAQLATPRFQPEFDNKARIRFYEDFRCGLLHRAEAKEMWLVRRKQPTILKKIAGGSGYILDPSRFHSAVKLSLSDYCEELLQDPQSSPRENLWAKMDHLCNVREERGVAYAVLEG